MNKQLKQIKGIMKEEVKSKKFDKNQISVNKSMRRKGYEGRNQLKAISKQVKEGQGHYDKHGNPIY